MMLNKKISKLFTRSYELYVVITIIVYSIFVSFFNRSFLSFENLFDILKGSSILGVMAIGVLVVMISGGIDVSFTAIAVVSMYATVYLMNRYPGNIFLAFLIVSVIGVGLGSVNAIIISYFKLPTLIVTLATSNIFYGLLLEIAPTAHITSVPDYLSKFGNGYLFAFQSGNGSLYGLSNIALTAIIVMIFAGILLRFTSLGRNIYAIGSNIEAAKRVGISIWRTQLFIYCFAGFLAGVASILNVALLRYVNPFNMYGVTMDVIAAVVLGGAILTGGHGSVIGTFLGILLLSLIRNSLIFLGIPSTYDSFIVGLVILLGVGFTTIREKRKIVLKG